MKDDCILRYSVFIRYLPPEAAPSNSASHWRRAAAAMGKMWAALLAALRPTSREDIEEAYLAQAVSHADLERRMRELQGETQRLRSSWPQ